MPGRRFNLFAVVDNETEPIRRIPLDANLQREISDFLSEQRERFYGADTELVDFSAGYRIQGDEIFVVRDYPIPEIISEAISNPLNVQQLEFQPEQESIKALFFGTTTGNSPFIGFQVFDSRKVLQKGKFTILFAGGTFTKLVDPGITLQNSLTALYQDGDLLFYKYANARRVLDLAAYYTEATDTEIEEFAGNELFAVDDLEALKTSASQYIRKKISLILGHRILDDTTLRSIRRHAREYGIEMETRDNRIVLPTERKRLKELVGFLDDDYFTAPLSKKKCFTNSKRYL